MSASVTVYQEEIKNELVVEAVVENDGQKNLYVKLGGRENRTTVAKANGSPPPSRTGRKSCGYVYETASCQS